MDNPISFNMRTKSRYPFLNFTLFVAIHPLGFLLAAKYLLSGIWAREVAMGFFGITITFVICHLIFCFGEFFFHRYILHILTTDSFRMFNEKHLLHHSLTSIHIDGSGRKIKSLYPIDNLEQDVSATFPPWTLLAFLAGFTPLLIILALILSGVPVLIAGYSALSLSYYLYETLHAMHHSLYDKWWNKKLRHPVLGKIWQKIYGFHQAHHANHKCNMNVGGFFGLPVVDILFGTYKQPRELLLDGIPATKETVQELNPRPRWPVSWFDELAVKRRLKINTNR